MKCSYCNHKLPDDSEFCQYCGNKVVKENVTSTETIYLEEFNFDNMTQEEAMNAFLEFQSKEVVKNIEANRQNQLNHENEMDFGLTPEKPIYTLGEMLVEGEKEFLNSLYTSNGEKITWDRKGSTSVEGINGMIDIYDTYQPSGQLYKTIYINMYGAKKSTKAPAGFIFNDVEKQPSLKIKKKVKSKFCSRCGSVIDNKTKVCTGCGKKYFKGIKFNKFSVTIIMMSTVIVALSTLSICQLINNKNQQNEISDLKNQLNNKESSIDYLSDEIAELKEKNLENLSKIFFYDQSVVIVADDGRDTYHKYGCSLLDTSNGYWILNPEAAEVQGYKECWLCQ